MNNSEIRTAMISAREEYINIIKAELLGPGSEFSFPDSEHELISSSPTSRYSVGILFPQGNIVSQDNDETVELKEVDSLEETSLIMAIDEEDEPDSVNSVEERRFKNYEAADENLDEEIGMSTQYMPSSMGITFLVKGDARIVRGKLTFATYRKAVVSDCKIPFVPDNPDDYVIPYELEDIISYDKNKGILYLNVPITVRDVRNIFEKVRIPENERLLLQNVVYRFADCCTRGYVRIPHEIPEFVLDFSISNFADNKWNQNLDGTHAKLVALRRQICDDLWSITVMLVNDWKETPVNAKHCIFQAKIEVSSSNNNFIFKESGSSPDVEIMDTEEKSLDLLYRHRKIYGTGLGTSVNWEIDSTGRGTIWSDFFPVIEIPPMDFSLPENNFLDDEELSMKYLSDLDSSGKNKKLSSLRKLVDLYKNWVDRLERDAAVLEHRYASAATNNIRECKRACERMYAGITTLENNDYAYNAFLLANRAMFMQRTHIAMQAEMAKKNADRYPGDEDIANKLNNMDYRNESDRDSKWRPFQIAFLLMDINSIVDDRSPERSIVDLIWFPTGGGKTEAYLGLTAFTIFYRRLAHLKNSAGTTVIMRYTLRLLAAQQFTRAATLICACEYIRNDCTQKKHKYPAYMLGKDPITIGLWIGGEHIPNKNEGHDGAKYHLEKLRNVRNYLDVRDTKERHNKFQVLKCPWCGTKMVKDGINGHLLGEWGYNIGEKHFYMFCPHAACDFTTRLPIQIIDEELYSTPPTLLFATVDKFAMLPWDGRIGAFFGIRKENRTPELIIQDELHLISGALGTMVGLYETAVDAICGRNGVYPKIIASTATIRRAKEQCSVLYNRDVVQFPAPGLDAEDSFFAKEATIDYEKGIYGRKYVGFMPSGKTKAMMEIRAMASMLQKIYTMSLPDNIKDKLWTLTVYFNSLKDLGKTFTLINDVVKDFIIRIANRMFTNRRHIISADELTSRVTTTELNETLDKLEKIEYSQENIADKRYASNLLLATNMISVGIDIARLNVMLMVGQPKLTSEYIQASSRVGRSYPGIVFMQYDATKSRDRSHYERFNSYHESFYRFVEPTGATPFSRPARERALHAVLIAMIRLIGNLVNDKDAIRFDSESFNGIIKDVKSFIISRIDNINHRFEGAAKENTDEISRDIDAILEFWQSYVDECKNKNPSPPLYFGKRYMVNSQSDDAKRLLKPYNISKKDKALETLTSMRNVDVPVTGSVLVWEDRNV